jgi:hypothetical protein
VSMRNAGDSTPPRWNSFASVYPVQIEGEAKASPRMVRLACSAMRVGDPVQVTDNGHIVTGTISGIVSAVVIVRRAA